MNAFSKHRKKRRIKQSHYIKSKRMENIELSQTDTESETDLSECSISYDQPQNEILKQSYSV